MKKLLFISFLFVSLAATAQDYGRVDRNTFKVLMENKTAVILDVRTPEEYSQGFISGALNMDFLDDSFPEKLKGMDKDKTYLIYCKSGGRSEEALKEMNSLGFNKVYELEEGYMGWSDPAQRTD